MSRERNLYRIPPGAKPPAVPGSPIDAPIYPWSTLNPTATRNAPASSESSQLHLNETPISYFSKPKLEFPEPELYHESLPYPSPRANPVPFGQHTAQSETGYISSESWQPSEPQIIRSVSHQSNLRLPSHSRTRAYSSTGPRPQVQLPQPSHSLRHKHSYSSDTGVDWGTTDKVDDAFERSPSIIANNLSRLSLSDRPSNLDDLHDLIRRYQRGEGDDNNWEWHRLVPKEAMESLPKAEVIRQSAIFELINGERNYVHDLELVQEVFIGGLESILPPVIKEGKTDAFINEVFFNLNNILAHHKSMVNALFSLQIEQHPIIVSIGHIILDIIFKFKEDYDAYIKHYPVAESVHRRELKNNTRYRKFLDLCSQDPRLGKRDLITFIARPVTRLPRLSLQLEEIKKRTEKLFEDSANSDSTSQADYPDLETIPILLDVLDRFVKNTQPGIAASESKVKYYALCESLEFRRGEIIDMDLYNETRSLVHIGQLARKQRADNWSKWLDLEVALLDNYLLITHPDPASGAKVVVSRPLPVEYIRLGIFNGPPDSRRDERNESGNLFHAFIKPSKPMYPFILYHASSPARKYTLYATSEETREKWRDVLEEAVNIRKIVMDSNKWFGMDAVEKHFFRIKTPRVPANSTRMFTGEITSATLFSANGKSYLVAATSTGIYAGVRGHGSYTKVLALPSSKGIVAMPLIRKLVVLHGDQLNAYSLDIIARISEKKSSPSVLEQSTERLAKAERGGSILFFRVGIVADRTMLVYASKGFVNVTINALEAVLESPQNVLRRIQSGTSTPSFRPFGEPFYVPKDPFDVTLLAKTIAISTERLMVVVDPTKISTQTPVQIPDFTDAGESIGISILKAKAESSRPLGIVKSGPDELIVIYHEFGCYVTKYAVPTRKAGYVRWETTAESYAERGPHILLFSHNFIEVRNTGSGRLIQVIEGNDFRLLQSHPGMPLLIATHSNEIGRQGIEEEVIELIETAPLDSPLTSLPIDETNALWQEWAN